MPSPRKSAARLFTSSCLTVAGLVLVGCESEAEKADEALANQLREVAPQRGEAAITGLKTASQLPGASAGATSNAKTLLAQAEVEQAQQVLRQIDSNNVSIARLISEITDIANRVSSHNTAVAGYQELSPKATAALAKWLADEQAKVEGKGATATWDLGEGGKVPALSAATEKAKALGEQVKALEAKKAGLVKQRTAADTKAGEALRQSKLKTGKASVDLFTQSVTAGKQAADLGNQIGQIDHDLLKLNQDLALSQAQAEQLAAAVKEFQARIAENAKSEQQLQALTESQKALSAALVNGDGSAPAPAGGDPGDTATPPADAPPVEAEAPAEPAAFQVQGEEAAVPAADAAAPADAPAAEPAAEGAAPTPDAAAEGAAPEAGTPAKRAAASNAPPSTIVTNTTMAAKAKELEGLLADTEAKRKTAVDLLTSALGHYDGALADAQKLRSELQTQLSEANASRAPQAAALKSLMAVYDPAKLSLQKAGVQHLLASVHRDATTSLVARRNMIAIVRPALQDASLDMPSGLDDPKLEEQLDAAQTAANEAYDATQTLLQDEVIDKATGDSEETRNAGQVAQVIALYGRSLLARAVNDTANADKFLSTAKQTVANGTIPPEAYPAAVRASLGLAAATPTTAPSAPAAAPGATTEPAADPAAAPATTPAPATAPADAPAADAAVPATAPS